MNYDKWTKAMLIKALKAEQQKNIKTFSVQLYTDSYDGFSEEDIEKELEKLIEETPILKNNNFFIDAIREE